MTWKISILAIAFFGCSTSSFHTEVERKPAALQSYSPTRIAEIFKGRPWVILSPADISKFDDIYFMSDIHGRLDAFTNLLYKAELVSAPNDNAKWIASRKLLILNGDYIDGGANGGQVLQWLSQLITQASGHSSRVVAMLGNHEAEFLADPDPSKMAPETLASFAQVLKMDASIIKTETITDSSLWKFVHSLPVAAFVGSWYAAHSGYMEGDPSHLASDISDYYGKTGSEIPDAFNHLSNGDCKSAASIISCHDWWDKQHHDFHQLLNAIGVNAFIGGHEPELFGPPSDREKILMSNEGWAIKIDTGLKTDPRNMGEMLHCKVSAVSSGAAGLNMVDSDGNALCDRILSDGSTAKL